MAEWKIVDPKGAKGRTRRVFREVERSFRLVPFLFRAHAISPPALEGIWHAVRRLVRSNRGMRLPRIDRERIAVLVAAVNDSPYCVDGHSMVLEELGEPAAWRRALARGRIPRDLPARSWAVLAFARAVARRPAGPFASDLRRLRAAGASDRQIAEATAVASLHCYLNRFVNVADILEEARAEARGASQARRRILPAGTRR